MVGSGACAGQSVRGQISEDRVLRQHKHTRGAECMGQGRSISPYLCVSISRQGGSVRAGCAWLCACGASGWDVGVLDHRVTESQGHRVTVGAMAWGPRYKCGTCMVYPRLPEWSPVEQSVAISCCCQPEAQDGAVRPLSRLALAVPVPSRDMACPLNVEPCAVLVRLHLVTGIKKCDH